MEDLKCLKPWGFLKDIDAEQVDFVFIDDVTKKARKGELLTKNEVDVLVRLSKSREPFIDNGGMPYVLFIYDRQRGFFQQNPQGEWKYKFHFMYCETLEKMDKKGTFPKYAAKHDLQDPYFDSLSGKKEMLDVCKNCLNAFSAKTKSFNKNVNSFNVKEFFDTYGWQDLPQPTGIRHGDYTPDWSDIARKKKESVGWACEKCGKSCLSDRQSLQVHHKDGVKNNNLSDNLIALCYLCHKKEHE
ncbi:MAG: HNH endonuclease signature motif containing protein [Candidatus Kaiserbacteria bacterium]|nr:HNH endonuclease signature motif containing protein [Candidatus Kaiserbacteria bacterium]